MAYLESRRRGAGTPAGRASLARMVIWPAALVTAVVVAAELLLNSYLGLPLFLGPRHHHRLHREPPLDLREDRWMTVSGRAA